MVLMFELLFLKCSYYPEPKLILTALQGLTLSTPSKNKKFDICQTPPPVPSKRKYFFHYFFWNP